MEGAANKPKSIQRKEVADYSFAFNESCFSDRTLQIVISMDPQEIRYDGAICLQKDDDDNGAVKVITVQVSAVILAESSQFFKKLFSSGMRETEQRHVSVHISPSEEQGLICLLKFMYGGAIEAQSAKELLDVLMLADKFEVASCIHGCTIALDSMPMTMEFAPLLLFLPSSLLTTNVMQPIVKAAEEFLLTHFSNKKFVEEYLNLPLYIIEQVLTSDELGVQSEDAVYNFAIDWARRHYQDQDERREVFQNNLIKLIRFPQMTDYKLAEILSNEDMHNASAMKLVSEAINFKGGCSTESYNLEDKRFWERSYECRPVRVVELHTPKREYTVFCDFNINENHSSQVFYMWGQPFSFSFSWVLMSFELGLHYHGMRLAYVVFLRSNISEDFCQVSRGKVTWVKRGKVSWVKRKNRLVLFRKEDIQNYKFNNVMHVQVIFTYYRAMPELQSSPLSVSPHE